MGGDAGKHNAQRTEKLRCLKYGSVIRLCRGHFPKGVFPDDLMGRAHLFELVCVASLAPACADQKVEHLIGLWAPWMPAGEVLKEAPCLPVHHRALAQPQRHRQDSVLH